MHYLLAFPGRLSLKREKTSWIYGYRYFFFPSLSTIIRSYFINILNAVDAMNTRKKNNRIVVISILSNVTALVLKFDIGFCCAGRSDSLWLTVKKKTLATKMLWLLFRFLLKETTKQPSCIYVSISHPSGSVPPGWYLIVYWSQPLQQRSYDYSSINNPLGIMISLENIPYVENPAKCFWLFPGSLWMLLSTLACNSHIV